MGEFDGKIAELKRLRDEWAEDLHEYQSGVREEFRLDDQGSRISTTPEKIRTLQKVITQHDVLIATYEDRN